jgi:hypothetical protein
LFAKDRKAWMPGTGPGMTNVSSSLEYLLA